MTKKVTPPFEQYTIHGISYSQPKLIMDANGEPVLGRVMVWMIVKYPCTYDGVAPKIVEKIEFNQEWNAFEVYFSGGSLKVIPRYEDTEIMYEPCKATKQN